MSRLLLCSIWVGLIGALAACQSGNCAKRAIKNEEYPEPQEKPMALPVYFGDGKVKCLTQSLIDQGFNYTFDVYTDIPYLGKINANGLELSIYYYDRNENHGNHAIVILENGCEYFGSYRVDDKPIKVSGADILFDAPKDLGNVIHFANFSPPARVRIDGQISFFAR